MKVVLVCVLFFYDALPIKASEEKVEVLQSPSIFMNEVKKYIHQNNNLSEDCSGELLQYVNAFCKREMWALKMFDASAKIPSGILDFNLVDLGSFNECIKVQGETTNRTIYGKYCIAELSLDGMRRLEDSISNNTIKTSNNFRLMMDFAICFPSACNGVEFAKMLQSFGISMNIEEDSCQTLVSQAKLNVGAIIVLSSFGLVLWWIIVSTAYDVILQHFDKAPLHYLLVSFSVYANGKKLFSTSKSADDISCLNGIRVISTLWIILGHSFLIQAQLPIQNSAFVLEWFTSQYNLYIQNALVSVDTFFFISGLTLSYIFMIYSKRGIKFNFLTFYIHRYLRLTPALAVVILFNVFLAKYMGSGPIWPNMIKQTTSAPCEKDWWRALLYIQNYGKEFYPCIPQSWYLSVDMQLFVLSPLLLLPLLRWPTLTLFATGLLTLCSVAASFAITWIYKLNITFFANAEDYMKYYYVTTHTRAAPWLLGIIFGYLIYEAKNKTCKIVLNTYLVCIFWVLSLTLLTVCVFTGYDIRFRNDELLKASFYNALIRVTWAIALAWVVFACQFGYGGVVNWFLSWNIFKVISKLTYTLYLTHFTVIVMTTADMKVPPVLSDAILLRNVWVHIMLSLFASILLTLGFESPTISIERILLKRTGTK